MSSTPTNISTKETSGLIESVASESKIVTTTNVTIEQQESKLNVDITDQQLSDVEKQKEAVQSPPNSPVVTTTTKISSKDSPVKTASPVVSNNKGVVFPSSLQINDIVNVVFPYARSATIQFTAKKLKPNTKYYAFFNEYNVTDFCTTGNLVSNVSGFSDTYMTSKLESDKLANIEGYEDANVIVAEMGNIFSDYKGFVQGTFKFDVSIGLKIPSGDIIFRLTDSATNSDSKESFADAVYTSIGRITKRPPKPVNYNSGGNNYGSGGSSSSGGNNNNTPINTDPTIPAGNYGWLDSHISYLLNIPLYAITDQQRSQYGKYYTKNSTGGYIFKNDATLQSLVPGAVDYKTSETRSSQSYDFKPISNTNRTVTNILDATNQSTGKTYVDDFKSQVVAVGGNDAWNMAVSSYEGTKAATTKIVNSGQATQEMKNFYAAGIANGSFTNDQAGINKAIANWSAATVVGMYDQNTTTSKTASTNTISNGFGGSTTTSSTTKNSSQLSTSTKSTSTIISGIV